MIKRSTVRAIMTIPSWVIVLIGIVKYPNLNVTNLSKKIMVSYTTTFRLVSSFEEKQNWVEITKPSYNTKDNKITLTDEGKRIYEETVNWLKTVGFNPNKKDFVKCLREAK